MHYRFPCVSADLHKLAYQPGIQQTLQDHRYGLVYHVICLFTSQAFTGYSFQLNQRRRAQAEQAWVQGGLPVTHLGTNRA